MIRKYELVERVRAQRQLAPRCPATFQLGGGGFVGKLPLGGAFGSVCLVRERGRSPDA
jgi:hypothetical protein